MLAAVERKRRELSILRLLGLPGRGLVGFPLMQALLTAGFGVMVASLAYLLTSALLNQRFADQMQVGETVCRLTVGQGGIAAVTTVLILLCAAGAGGWRAARIEPAEGLRDV
jgi:putative ABC transport system permease protein